MASPTTGAKSAIGSVTALKLITASTPITYGVLITAAAANTGQVYIGLSTVTKGGTNDGTDGFELSATQSVFIPSAFCSGNLSNIYVVASASSHAVYFLAS